MKPISLKPKRSGCLFGILVAIVVIVIGGYYVYKLFFSLGTGRWTEYPAFISAPEKFDDVIIKPGMRCDDSLFAFPTTGAIFGLWGQSYGLRTTHTGLDIFPGTDPGVTPVYAAYDGFLTRESDWISTIIIRIPNDPLEPNRQIWTYYTHMADVEGNSFVSEEFPQSTYELFVEAGTLLGYIGDYSGDPLNPTGLHLHFSIVKDDGTGSFLNETQFKNTLDPSLYFNMALYQNDNPSDFPVCEGEVTYEDWGLKD